MNSMVCAKYGDTDHFLVGKIIALIDNGNDDQCTVLFHGDTEGRLVNRNFIFKIQQQNSGGEQNVPSWYTKHMIGINEKVGGNLSRFTTIATYRQLRPVDFLGMLMMDAFREEIYRQCQIHTYKQWLDLRNWFHLKGQSILSTSSDFPKENVYQKESTKDFSDVFGCCRCDVYSDV